MSSDLLSIGELEQQTGIRRDTLRIWERRYGFPDPQRGQANERSYSREQLERLQLIKQLCDCGIRPGKLAGLALEELGGLARQIQSDDHQINADVSGLMRCLTEGRPSTLGGKLEELLLQHGVKEFLCGVVAPMNRAVGDAWMNGSIGVMDEHFYAELIRSLLGGILQRHTPRPDAPMVLLTTLPGEQHGIGLLMAGCMLAHEGAAVTMLGVQTPLDEIVRGAVGNSCAITGISCSSYLGRRSIAGQLIRLRNLLPQQISLWAGGSGVSNLPAMPKGVELFHDLKQIPTALRVYAQDH